VVSTVVAGVSVCIGGLHAGVWKLSLPTQATVHPHRIFLAAFYITPTFAGYPAVVRL
jgi:hypothetical protein